MLFHRSKSKQMSSKGFFIGDIPTRPGRRQIDLEKTITTKSNTADNTRVGEFNMTTGYHPVRPAIMTNTETITKSTAIQPFNTNHIIPISVNKHRRIRFLHRRKDK
jgi:hypothetical protein